MKNLILLYVFSLLGTAGIAQLKADDVQVSFYSKKEDIAAKNTVVSSTLDVSSGVLTFEVKIDAFEFINKTMQKHFNQEGVMNSTSFPVARFEGKIINNATLDYTANGKYDVTVEGTMTIKGVSKELSVTGQIIIDNGNVTAISSFDLDRFEYGVTAKEQSVSQILLIQVEAQYK